MNYLGIDVGTSGTRALILDEQGTVLASGHEEHANFASPQPGWAEQDPRDWWRAAALAVRKALQASGLSAESIAAVGFSGQMHGAVLLDENDEVIRPALIWCDQRTEAQSKELERTIGLDRLIQLTCNPPLTNFTLTKLLWVRKHEPQNWQRVRKIMLPKDYVRFRLTGESAIDVADASGTLMLDVAHRTWSSEVLYKTGIDVKLLPKLFESPGYLRKDFASRSRRNRSPRRNSGCRWRRRSSRRSRRHGHHARRSRQRHHRNVRRRLCRHGSPFDGPQRPPAHFLSRHPRPLARHGSHASRRTISALVPRSLWRADQMTDAIPTTP